MRRVRRLVGREQSYNLVLDFEVARGGKGVPPPCLEKSPPAFREFVEGTRKCAWVASAPVGSARDREPTIDERER